MLFASVSRSSAGILEQSMGARNRVGMMKKHVSVPLCALPIFSASCTVKKVRDFPVPSRDVNYQTLPGGE
jgi:hypothetical protein